MDVRQANQADFEACLALPPTVQTTHVWQLRLAYDPISVQPTEELGGTLHCTRLPRPIVLKPASVEPLDVLWARAAEVLVVEDDHGVGGYVALTVDEGATTIGRLVVAPTLRRGGVGGALLRAAQQWSSAMGLERLVGHCSARNHPAVNFYLRWGLRFAGYSEAFYPYGEVALFFHVPT